MSAGVTRLAPSPTGALHLGNARTFLINWLLARRNGWKIILRIEDLDGPRIKKNADQLAIEDLQWLGLDWDEGPIYQSTRFDKYAAVVSDLLTKRQAYYCTCSRKEVEQAASAPHAEDGATIYPGTCRGKFNTLEDAMRDSRGRKPAVRFQVSEGDVAFHDHFAGDQSFNPARDLGDFVIAKSDNTPAYQLSVVLDDADMNVTHIVRGDDLLDSTPRQILLYHALDLADEIPHYYHLPLILGPDGKRLAKRHGDSRLSHYRDRGISASTVLSLLARWSNMHLVSTPTTASDLLPNFAIENVPHHPITFNPTDLA